MHFIGFSYDREILGATEQNPAELDSWQKCTSQDWWEGRTAVGVVQGRLFSEAVKSRSRYNLKEIRTRNNRSVFASTSCSESDPHASSSMSFPPRPRCRRRFPTCDSPSLSPPPRSLSVACDRSSPTAPWQMLCPSGGARPEMSPRRKTRKHPPCPLRTLPVGESSAGEAGVEATRSPTRIAAHLLCLSM